jgi:hypothetical protein
MVIRTYYCPRCMGQIDVMAGKPGTNENCPHCGVVLRGITAARVNELTETMVGLIFLTVFFAVMSIFFPPILFVALLTGTGAYFVNRSRKAAMGTSGWAVKERTVEAPSVSSWGEAPRVVRLHRTATNNFVRTPPQLPAFGSQQRATSASSLPGGVSMHGTPGAVKTKDKTVAVLLAIFLSFWTWCYTYRTDAWKFWLNLGLFVVSIGFWGPVAWIWAIVDAARRPKEFYDNFNQPPLLGQTSSPSV